MGSRDSESLELSSRARFDFFSFFSFLDFLDFDLSPAARRPESESPELDSSSLLSSSSLSMPPSFASSAAICASMSFKPFAGDIAARADPPEGA